MHFSTVFASVLLAGVSVAQDPNAPAPSGGAPPNPAPSGSVMVQVVKVGGMNGELTFTPSDIQAQPGSMVQFQFYPKNHSVAQATFAQPCMPISMSQPNVTSPLWSGFMPTDPKATMMATYTVMINNTQPIWLYCAQGDHCQKGMVAAINANNSTGKTVQAFKDAASKATTNMAPGAAGSNSTTPSSPAPSDGSSSGSPGSSGTPASPSAASSSGDSKVASNSASSVTYGASTLALAGLLSVFVGFAL